MASDRERKRFEELYQTHARLIRSVLYHMVVDEASLDDLVQETFLRVWKSAATFEDRSSVTTWVYRIAMNAAIDSRRKRTVRKEEPLSFEPADQVAGASKEESVSRALHEAVGGLEEIHRSVVVLHYFEGLDLARIAEILEIPQGTVKSRLHSAREKLQASLKAKGIFDEQW